MGDVDLFVPGAYWTPELSRAAERRMSEEYGSPELQAALQDVSPDAPPAPFEPMPPPALPDGGVRSLDQCVFRRGHESDVLDLASMMQRADLPPLFIEPFIRGFLVAEAGGAVIGCGGIELYGDIGVIRSVVVDERVRGLQLGRRIADLLFEDARESGASTVYLFTADALPFWLRMGFREITLDDWREPARVCWQWQFLHANRDAFEVHTMERATGR